MGRRFDHGVTDSTNERALIALAAGRAIDGDWHVAEEQTTGRGRLGRSWHSPEGQGLYLSWIHKPTEPLHPAAPSVAAGLALLDTVNVLGLEGARLRWPNDLMVAEAKLAGILVETRGFDPTSPAYVVGLGINVTGASLPKALHDEREVTSLGQLGLDVEARDLEAPLLSRLHARFTQAAGLGATELCLHYLEALQLGTGPVVASTSSASARGKIAELDLARGIAIETEAGLAWIPLEFLKELKGLA